MFKKVFCIWMAAFLLLPVLAFASPETMKADEAGSATDLIVLNNTTGESNTTFEANHVLSGSGQQDVVATLYVFDSTTNEYKKVYVTKDGNLVAAEWQIGASGLFMQEVSLAEGKNMLAVRAEKDGQYQVVKLEIVRINQDFFAVVQGIKVDLSQLYDAIVKGQ